MAYRARAVKYAPLPATSASADIPLVHLPNKSLIMPTIATAIPADKITKLANRAVLFIGNPVRVEHNLEYPAKNLHNRGWPKCVGV